MAGARLFLLFVLLALLAGCAVGGSSAARGGPDPGNAVLSASVVEPTLASTARAQITHRAETAAARAVQTRAAPTPTYDPAAWQDLPVLPELSPRAQEILARGLKRNNPHAFSKIGDCESQASWFLEPFDLGPAHYALGDYETELSPVIDFYAGSYKRLSLAARPGFSASSLLAPIWADQQQCEKDETPLDCEYRINRPLVAFVMVGTNDATNPKTFERHMRAVIERSIALDILPVLGTKADNVEGDHAINATMARLAQEYGLPVWNYWAAVQPLPAHGLQEDGVHLTFAAPYFDRPGVFERAWPVRNLNALQVLKILKEATEQAQAGQ